MTVTVVILGGFAGIMQFSVVRPIHQRFEYINQRFDAQDKRIDDLRADMNQRFDDQNKYFNQRIDDQNRFILQGFDTVNQRFDAQDKYINQRFDAQDRRIEDLAKDVSELRKLSDRVSRNETRIDALTEQLQTADAPTP
jgi:rRNA maturation protein Nop10